ncbi:MAG: hypothetical protein WKG06_23890 [Segetibacter sp.]
MQIIPLLLKEMEQEAAATRKMLERVPADKFSWKPHEKKHANATTVCAYCRAAIVG